jgi:hypothetical protein
LAERVVNVLEVVSDLTRQVEVLIVDDGSTDQTDDVAREISREYPQIRAVRHGKRRGFIAATWAGIEQTCGEIIMLHDIQSAWSHEAVRQLWDARHAVRPTASVPKSPDALRGDVPAGGIIVGGTQLWQRALVTKSTSPRPMPPGVRNARTLRADSAVEFPPPLTPPSSLIPL